MRRITTWLLIFIAGWWLSRVTYNHLDSQQQKPAQPVVSAPLKFTAPEIVTQKSGGADMAALLQHNEFEAAVERYELLRNIQGDAEAVNTRRQILARASELITELQFALAEQLLQRFLVAAYRDVEASLLLAEVYLGQEDFSAAIDKFYEARGYAYRPLMLQRINGRIRSMVAEKSRSLKAANSHNELLTVYQHLTQLEPDYAPWFLGLAAAQLALNDLEAARRSLLLIAQDAEAGPQARAMLSELSIALADSHEEDKQVAVQEVIGIPLYRRGNHFIVDARQDHGSNIRLLIDTGASMTILTHDVIAQSGLRYQDTGRSAVFNTANGPVRASVYSLDSLAVGDWQVNQLEVGVLELNADSNFDGLLGMNFLRYFQFFIDQKEALLRLSVN